MIAVIIVAAVWSAMTWTGVVRPASSPQSATPAASSRAAQAPQGADAPTMAAWSYIRASALAAERGDPYEMRPFVDQASDLWRRIVNEYDRRTRTGERRTVALERMHVEFSAVTGETAVVRTVETWMVRTYAYDRTTSMRYVGQFTYRLRRTDDGWKVVDVEDIPVAVETFR